jgi:Taurine catabolism dioxygenase TauD, TfdA family
MSEATLQKSVARLQMAGPTVWNHSSLGTQDYVIAVKPHQAAACLRIRDELRRRAKRLDNIEASDFQDPALAEIARDIHHRIHSCPGFCVLRGLPLQGWTDEEASMLYWGLGTYLGAPQPQNRAGDRVYLVQDTGKSVAEARGSKTNSELIFHTDSASGYIGIQADVLGLLCLRKAVSGGESQMVSGHTAYNTLLKTRPDLVEELYGEFCFDRSKETGPGEDPVSVGAVFTDSADGVRVRYNRAYIELGHLLAGRPLSERQREALDAFDRVLNDPANHLEFTLHPGDVFFADDYVTLHNRRRFVDAPEVTDRRCLVRLWLAGEPVATTAALLVS